MHAPKPPRDRSLRAFRLAREYSKEPGISIDGVIEKIQATEPGIDRETAWVAADQAANERRETARDAERTWGYMILMLCVSGVVVALTGEWQYVGAFVLAVLILWLLSKIREM